MSNPPPPPDHDAPKPPPARPAMQAAVRAVLTGMSVDICGTALLGYIIASVYAAQVTTPDMTPAQVDEAVRSIPSQSPLVTTYILLGALISVAAGYVCARIARRNEVAIGAVMAGGTTLVDLAIDNSNRPPTDLAVLFILCSVACAMLGVRYGAALNRRLEAPSATAADTSAP